jgi:hypothetical protein
VVRQRYTRYWRADGACVSRAPGGWTRVTPVRGGRVEVRAGFGLGRGESSGSCADQLAGG